MGTSRRRVRRAMFSVTCAPSATTTTCAVKATARSQRVHAAAQRRSVVVNAGTGKFIVGGNWKCNGTAESVKSLVKELNSGKIDADVDVYVAPPFVFIPRVQKELNAGNCDELAQKEDIDGFLVGGASLIGEAFVTICNSAKHSK